MKPTSDLWFDLQPGDIGFDAGSGFVGWVIRHGTGSAYAHTFIYHSRLATDVDGTEHWLTVEAYPSRDRRKDGVRWRVRTDRPDKVLRLFTGGERLRLLDASAQLADAAPRYGWLEILRIAGHMLGLRLRRRRDNPRTAICSNHVTQAVLAARPSLQRFIEYPHWMVWPGHLATVLDAVAWVHSRVDEVMSDEEH